MRAETDGRPRTTPGVQAYLDYYVSNVVLSVARQCGGDSGALTEWMRGQAAWCRKRAAEPFDLAVADCLEQLAAEVLEARAPHTRH
jgi:hypothetical protein